MRHKLRTLRKQKGVSQTFLAEKLGYKHPSGYCNIESGRNRLSLEHAVIIADILGVSVSDIAEETENFLKNSYTERVR